jgi:PAS domain S-box-containing protein
MENFMGTLKWNSVPGFISSNSRTSNSRKMAAEFLTTANDTTSSGKNKVYSGSPISETITNGFFTVDQKWTVKYWNKAAENILSIQAKDIVGMNLWEKFSDIIPIEFYNVYHFAFLQNVPAHFEEYWGEMGAWFDVITYHCDDTLSVSFKSHNKPAQPENSERQLTILNELYRFVTEVTNDCLWEWNFESKDLFWIDGGHRRVFGYPIENAIIPQSFWESLVHPDDKERVLTGLNKIINEGTSNVWEDEYRFKKITGDYAYVYDRGHIIYGKDRKACRMIGATQDITARQSAESKLIQERLTRQKEITHAVLAAQEKERANIGRELHNNLNQILGAAKLYIETAKKDEAHREICLERSCDYIVSVIGGIRNIANTLAMPTMIEGLFESIQIIIADLAIIMQALKIDFQKNGINEEELNEDLEFDIFRIVQEQLNNIIKHAKATWAIINLTRNANEIILLISDNGQGCDLLKTKMGTGIINIVSRAELYDGYATTFSKPGEGYELKVVFTQMERMNTLSLAMSDSPDND